MNFGLPKLPGYNFTFPTNNRYHLSHKCKVINGYRSFVETNGLGIGHQSLDVDSVGFLDLDNTSRLDPTLIYGRARSEQPNKFIPHHAIYANKCLTFRAYYKQHLPLAPNDNFLVHHVNIHYFLEDDTLTVIEPKIPNSGFLEGRIIRRRRIEKPGTGRYWHWKDLQVDIDIDLQGIRFRTISCDHFTKEFMRSQGIDIHCDDVFAPSDSKDVTPKYHLFKRPASGAARENIYKIKYAGRDDVLNFQCVWENDEDRRQFVLSYYLEDDTVTVRELKRRNDGRDPFSKLLGKVKLPKYEEDFFHSIVEENQTVEEYYGPEDLLIGTHVNVFGRKFLLENCDPMTRYFYENVLNLPQPDQIAAEDNSTSCNPFAKEIKRFNFARAKATVQYPKDELKFILNANKYLRYSANMISSHPEDIGRQFIITYALADDTLKIVELKQPNFGIMGGTFLGRQKVIKPSGEDAYTVEDLYIGAVINVYKHLFRITGADLRVLNYVEENKDKFPINVYESLKEYASRQGYRKTDDLNGFVSKIDDEDACFVKNVEGEQSIDVDPDAPTVECRFPVVSQGHLQDKQCAHSKDLALAIRDSVYDEQNRASAELYKPLDGESLSMEKHDKVECPVSGDPGLASHTKKTVTFAI